MPRYVILEHDHPFLHWDFMLEAGTGLRTWRLATPPEPGQVIAATPLGEHRRLYLDYEGPLSGDRGRVVRWDAGTFRWLTDTGDRIVVQLQEGRVHGTVLLERTGTADWTFRLAANR